MLALFRDNSIAKRIYKFVKELSQEEQELILSKVEEKYLLEKAKEADRSIKTNTISMDDVVAESREIRKKIVIKYNMK